jgi:conjugative transposon TraK protein
MINKNNASPFPKTKNIESSFRYIRTFTLIVIAGSLLLCGFVIGQALRAVDRSQSRIYILSAGKAFEAFSSDRKPNLAVEARWHVINFHNDFFDLAPDEKYINAGLKRALYLADASAKRAYDNLRESGYYANVISSNISQSIVVDSVSLNMDIYPFYFRCYATETITRPTSVVTRDLVSEGYLREVYRSENNPHGFLIEKWSILENRDLKVQQR